jgi:hypothetical protein
MAFWNEELVVVICIRDDKPTQQELAQFKHACDRAARALTLGDCWIAKQEVGDVSKDSSE